ncbi:MAG: hypothetical protein ACFB21_04975 [Opitutales bacterium]
MHAVSWAHSLGVVLPVACAVGLSLGASEALGVALDAAGVGLFALGALATYALDSGEDFGRQGFSRFRGLCLALTAFAMLGMVGALLMRPEHVVPVGVLAALSLPYRWLKNRVPKELIIAGGWTFAIAALALGPLSFGPVEVAFFLSLAALLAANAMFCDLLDVSIDAETAVRCAAQDLGARRTRRLASALAVGSGLIFLCLPLESTARFGFAAAAGGTLLAGRRRSSSCGPARRRLLIDGLLVIPVLVALLV